MPNLPSSSLARETQYLRLARDIATDLHSIETILKNNEIEQNEWETIQRDPRFLKLFEAELLAWNSAQNTPERVKIKSAMLIEEWLLEANRLAHDHSQTLSSKVELMKLLKALAGLGLEKADVTAGERFSLTINLGADQKLKIEKEVTSKVIEHQPIEE